MAGPRQVVDGPSFTPLPYGLWEAVEKPTAANAHWQNGITWADRCSAGDTVYEECIAVTGTGGSPTGQASLSSNVTQQNRGATPFTVYAEFDCSPVGLTDAETVARQSLEMVEGWQVERAFWTGVAGKTASGGIAQTTVWPHLASFATLSDSAGIQLQSAASPVATGASGDVADVLGQLEAALDDCYRGRGVIHVPREAAPTFFAWDLFEEDPADANLLVSPGGHRVVIGGGYTASSPSNVAPSAGTAWIYGTGPVFGYRSDIQVSEMPGTFDRTENTMKLIAQRTYVLGWSCCHIASLVTLGVPT
jgi:hypothetical protein